LSLLALPFEPLYLPSLFFPSFLPSFFPSFPFLPSCLPLFSSFLSFFLPFFLFLSFCLSLSLSFSFPFPSLSLPTFLPVPFPSPSLPLLFPFLSCSGVSIQGLLLARPVLYHLSHTSRPFCLVYFPERIYCFCLWLAWACDSPTSTSHIAGIIGMYHNNWPNNFFLM
jgi:hypothetical protein